MFIAKSIVELCIVLINGCFNLLQKDPISAFKSAPKGKITPINVSGGRRRRGRRRRRRGGGGGGGGGIPYTYLIVILPYSLSQP